MVPFDHSGERLGLEWLPRMQQKGLDFGGSGEPVKARRRAFTVSELTDRIQGVLEVEFACIVLACQRRASLMVLHRSFSRHI